MTNGVEKSTGGTAGAMYISGAQVQMGGTAFTGNKAQTNGGAIVLGRSTYTKNGTKLYSDAKLDIYGGTFSGNYATKVGGCMLLQSTGTVVNMTGGTITGNSSGNSAGGIYASTNTTFTMTGGAVIKNSSAFTRCAPRSPSPAASSTATRPQPAAPRWLPAATPQRYT